MTPSIRPTRVEVSAAALRHNFAALRRLAGPAEVMPVVKADAYGHGAVAVARLLESEGTGWLVVFLVEEALELRDAGLRTRLLVLGGAYDGGWEEMVRQGITPVLFRPEHIDGLGAAARAAGRRVPAHVKLDTGLGRLGLLPEEVDAFLARARANPEVELEGLCSHLAYGDGDAEPFSAAQWERFRQGHRRLQEAGFWPRIRHLSKSGGLVSLPQARDGEEFNAVRPGLMLYGLLPSEGLAVDVRPAMRWVTEVIHLKVVAAGTPISYNATWIAQRPSAIATLPVGFADGYPRLLSNRGQVLVRGRRVPVVGRVCMDLIMVDVTDVPGVMVGDEVTLMGRQGDSQIPAEALAGWAQTSTYEVVSGVSARVPRVAAA
ncbi:MAG TPA: alanine racemase [Myxococcaceae bacterium]|nr:alanine racemase [Myxococcaceae bacterium]